MTKKEVLELFKLLTTVYPQFKVDQYKIDQWSELLKDQSVDVVFHNAKEHAKSNKFPPSVAEVREQGHRKTAPATPFVLDMEMGEDW